MARTTPDDGTTPARPRLHVALELSLNTWKLALTTSRTGKIRIHDVIARDLSGFLTVPHVRVRAIAVSRIVVLGDPVKPDDASVMHPDISGPSRIR